MEHKHWWIKILKGFCYNSSPLELFLEVPVVQNHRHDLQPCLPITTKKKGKAHSQLALSHFKNEMYIMEVEAL